MSFTVYVVWSLEDADNVEIYLDPDLAYSLLEEYGEFGMMEEKEFTL